MGKDKKILKTIIKLIEKVLNKNKHHKHDKHKKDIKNVQHQPPPTYSPPPIPIPTSPNPSVKRKISSLSNDSYVATKKRNATTSDIPIISNYFLGGLLPTTTKPIPSNENFNDRIRDSREVEKSSQGVTRKWLFNYSNKKYKTPQECYNDFIHNTDIMDILHNLANEMSMIKFFFTVRSIYLPDESTDSEDEITIFSRSRLCEITKFSNTDEIETMLENIFNQISEDDNNHPQSGLSFQRMNTIELYVTEFRIIHGSSFIALPTKYQGLRCFINVLNDDNQCFKWSVLAALHSNELKSNRDKPESYMLYEKNYKWDMLTYPVDATDYKSINEFEEQNHLNINIYYEDMDMNNNDIFIPIRISKQSKHLKYEVVNLLLIKNNYDSHYVVITSLESLFRKMIGKKCKTNNIFVCPYCLFYTYDYSSFFTHNMHDCQDNENILRLFPNSTDNEKSYVKFKHLTHLQILPVTLYYDSKTYFQPYEREIDLKRYKKHNNNDDNDYKL